MSPATAIDVTNDCPPPVPTGLGANESSAPDESTAAKDERGCPFTVVNVPPKKTRPAAVAMAWTEDDAPSVGAHDATAPVTASTRAMSARPMPPTLVNDPPTYRSAPETCSA